MKIVLLHRKQQSREHLIEKICIELTRRGYQWEIHEDQLLVVKQGNKFCTYIWDCPNKKFFRTYFVLQIKDTEFKHIDNLILDAATCVMNREYPHTTSMMIAADTYMCRFETALCEAEDFIQEFEFAYDRISEARNFFFEELKRLERYVKYSNEDDDTEYDFDKRAEYVASETGVPGNEYPWEDPLETIILKANDGDGESVFRIGVCYTFGLYGFEKDKQMALECYQNAMDENNYQAMFNLAAMYSNAEGVDYNHDKAIELLSRIERECNNYELANLARATKKLVNRLESVEYLIR